MYSVIRSDERDVRPTGSVKFEGEGYGSGISFFVVSVEPGGGPRLHKHPYSETWIIRGGRARFTADGDDLEAGPGDVVVAGTDTPHAFTALGPDRLEMVCIHASPRMVEEWLEEER